jgi:hypothetical protein
VEIGQLMFVGAVLAARALLLRCRLPQFAIRLAQPSAAYVVGMLAAFWFFERVAGFSS